MSSTTGIQNLLVNVLRPVYTYDAVASLYTVKLDISNVNTYFGTAANVLWAQVGDSASNVYVGKEAGNDPTKTTRSCSNVTAIGYGAGSNTSNVSNSTYLGFYAGQGAETACNVIAIGANANGNGVSNIFIGNGTGTVGSNNILIGHGITLSNASYAMRVGTAGRTTLAADLSQAWVGVGGVITPTGSNTTFDVSGNAYFLGNVGINISPGNRTLDINGNFRSTGANGTLDFSNGTLGVINGTADISDAFGSVRMSKGIVDATGGLASYRSVLPDIVANFAATVGTLKRGVVLVSAQDEASSTTHYASRMVYCPNPANGATVVAVGSNVQAGEVTIVFSSSSIQISNANTMRSIAYSITYFPLP